MGVIFYELLYGMKPFGHGMSQQAILDNKIITNSYDVTFPDDKRFRVSDAAKDFILECLKYDQE